MATPIAKNTTIIGVAEEGPEGTYAAPSAATSYVQPLEDGFEMTPAKELVERSILTSSVGQVTPRVGLKSVTAALPVELRGSGVEGGMPDFDLLLESALGTKRLLAARVTTKAAPAHTTTVLQIEDADIASLRVGDVILILEAGSHSVHAITAKTTGIGTATVTYSPARAVFPSASVQIAKFVTYLPANASHLPLSLSYYWANEILQKAIGCKVTSLAVENFSTGQVASFNFGLEGLTFDEVNGSAPHTPVYDTGLPPLILQACLFQDGVELQINEFALSLENTLGFLTSTCSASGRIKSRVTDRSISGSFNPYKDDTSVDQFTKFNANSEYSLFISAYNPSSVAGEIQLGSVVGIYLPKCITIEKVVGDQEGLLVDNINFRATRGDSGSMDEMFLGFI